MLSVLLPANVRSALLRVRTLLTSGKIDLAHAQAKALVQANPDDAPSLALLGDVLFRESKFTEAEWAYDQAVQVDRSYARGDLLQNFLTLSRGRVDRELQEDTAARLGNH